MTANTRAVGETDARLVALAHFKVAIYGTLPLGPLGRRSEVSHYGRTDVDDSEKILCQV